MSAQNQRANLPEPSKQTQNTNTQSANQWRQENGYTGQGGVVVLCQSEAQGWIDKLRDPQNWQPGCIAVDEAGNEWIAVGGNDYDGAKSWNNMGVSHV